MHDIRIDGIATMVGGQYGVVHIDGIGQCEGDITAKSIHLDGKFKSVGSLTADSVSCDGMAEITKSIFTKNLRVDGFLTLAGGNIEATEIYCDGAISAAHGHISADKFQADGYVNAREIVGDTLFIHSHVNRLVRLFKPSFSKVDLIEATSIDITGVTAQTVNGHDVRIGPRCVVDNVDCSGTLFIDPSASVKNITGDHILVGR